MALPPPYRRAADVITEDEAAPTVAWTEVAMEAAEVAMELAMEEAVELELDAAEASAAAPGVGSRASTSPSLWAATEATVAMRLAICRLKAA